VSGVYLRRRLPAPASPRPAPPAAGGRRPAADLLEPRSCGATVSCWRGAARFEAAVEPVWARALPWRGLRALPCGSRSSAESGAGRRRCGPSTGTSAARLGGTDYRRQRCTDDARRRVPHAAAGASPGMKRCRAVKHWRPAGFTAGQRFVPGVEPRTASTRGAESAPEALVTMGS
jgi:hypothetical protein